MFCFFVIVTISLLHFFLKRTRLKELTGVSKADNCRDQAWFTKPYDCGFYIRTMARILSCKGLTWLSCSEMLYEHLPRWLDPMWFFILRPSWAVTNTGPVCLHQWDLIQSEAKQDLSSPNCLSSILMSKEQPVGKQRARLSETDAVSCFGMVWQDAMENFSIFSSSVDVKASFSIGETHLFTHNHECTKAVS